MSFLGSGLFVLGIRKRETAPKHEDERSRSQGMRAELSEGLRYVLGNKYLRWIAASTATFNFFGSMMGAIFLVYAVRELGLERRARSASSSPSATSATSPAPSRRTASQPPWRGTDDRRGASAGVATLLVPLAPESGPIPFLIVSR